VRIKIVAYLNLSYFEPIEFGKKNLNVWKLKIKMVDSQTTDLISKSKMKRLLKLF